jgi:hypothetical protein
MRAEAEDDILGGQRSCLSWKGCLAGLA